MQFLLKEGVDINTKLEDDMTPLHIGDLKKKDNLFDVF